MPIWRAVTGTYLAFERTGEAQPEAFSGGLHVPAQRRAGAADHSRDSIRGRRHRFFDIARCDIKRGTRRQAHAAVLKSEPAAQVNIAIMRAFVRLRRMIAAHKALARKIDELEKKFQAHDSQFQTVSEAIRELLNPAPPPHRASDLMGQQAERSFRGAPLQQYPERVHKCYESRFSWPCSWLRPPPKPLTRLTSR